MKSTDHKRILIANRGEIASRIIKTIWSMDKTPLVVHSEADRELPFVEEADESYSLGNGALSETYLDQDKIISIAKEAKADAIHPGYGFLSENSSFAARCKAEGIAFIGPDAAQIDLMGQKAHARENAEQAGIPVIKGLTGSIEQILDHKSKLRYPLLIKPAAGGGGKGMHIVKTMEALEEALNDAAREAEKYFSSADLYVEHFIEAARHIEVQVLADKHGSAIHLYERECSIQRRYQKVIEEAPSPSISTETRKALTDSALKLVRKIAYHNAGTIEFLLDEKENFYFIEMNTRIQVEHPLTEMITGFDLVREQIRISEGKKLSYAQEDIQFRGHAIEVRLYSEDPEEDFIPSAGPLQNFSLPSDQCRIDAGYRQGNVVRSFYDPMLAKIIVHAGKRSEAIEKLKKALSETHVTGVQTNRDLLYKLLSSKDFTDNLIHTAYIDQHLDSLKTAANKEDSGHETILICAALAALNHRYTESAPGNVWQEIAYWRNFPQIKLSYQEEVSTLEFTSGANGTYYSFSLKDKKFEVLKLRATDSSLNFRLNGQDVRSWHCINGSEILIDIQGQMHKVRREDIPDRVYNRGNSEKEAINNDKNIVAPLHGKVVKVLVKESDIVMPGDTLLIIESMKMENKIAAHVEAEIEKIFFRDGDLVEKDNLIMTFK